MFIINGHVILFCGHVNYFTIFGFLFCAWLQLIRFVIHLNRVGGSLCTLNLKLHQLLLDSTDLLPLENDAMCPQQTVYETQYL